MQFKTVLLACALAPFAFTPGAFAQTALATAPDTPAAADQGPVSTSGAKATDDNIARLLQDAKVEPESGASGRYDDRGDGQPRDKAIHGEFGVAAGNHGYREAYGVATMPLGDHGSATVAVDDTQGRFWGRNYNARSLAVSLAFGDAAGPPHPVNPCDPHLRSDHRYVEPLWVTRMREDRIAQGKACQ